MMFRIAGIIGFGLLLAPLWGLAQDDDQKEPTPWWERSEEEKSGRWFFRSLFTTDFYPFDFNDRTGYEGIRGFNASVGGELLYTEEGNPNAYGGGIIYSFKDYDQEILDNNAATEDEDVISATHEIRYVELPIILQHDFIRNEKNRVFWDVALMPALMDHADSRYQLNSGGTSRRSINDSEFARFLLGARFGGGYSTRLSESFSVGTGLFTKIYLTDMFKEQYVNFSSIGIRLNITYHLGDGS